MSWLALGAALALISATAFLVLARVIAADTTRELDVAVLRGFAAHRTNVLTTLFLAATFFGSWQFTSAATLVLCVALVRNGQRRIAATFAGAVLGIPMLDILLKPLYARPRPDIVAHLQIVDSASFPSGHALAASIFFGTLSLLAARRAARDHVRVLLAASAVLAVMLVATSRVYLGVHYPSDVLGGVLAGMTWSLLVLLTARLTEARSV